MKEQPKGYCSNCGKKKEIKDPTKKVADNNREYLEGECVDCGRTVLRFV